MRERPAQAGPGRGGGEGAGRHGRRRVSFIRPSCSGEWGLGPRPHRSLLVAGVCRAHSHGGWPREELLVQCPRSGRAEATGPPGGVLAEWGGISLSFRKCPETKAGPGPSPPILRPAACLWWPCPFLGSPVLPSGTRCPVLREAERPRMELASPWPERPPVWSRAPAGLGGAAPAGGPGGEAASGVCGCGRAQSGHL